MTEVQIWQGICVVLLVYSVALSFRYISLLLTWADEQDKRVHLENVQFKHKRLDDKD